MPTFTTNYGIPKPLVNDPQDEDLWGDYLNDGMDIIDSTLASIAGGGGGGTPSGAIIDYAGTTAPSGWQFCYGQAINRTTYAALFTAIGTTYGAGDGSTTFNLPDCRGRVSAGKDDMGGTSANRLTGLSGGVNGDTLGGTGGAESHTLSTAQLATHSHTLSLDSSGGHTHTIEGADRQGGTPSYADLYTGGTQQTFANSSNGVTVSVAPSSNYLGNTSANGGVVLRAKSSGSEHTHTGLAANAGSGDAHNNVQPTIIFNKIIKE